MRIHFKTDYLQDIRLFEDRREMIQYILLILAALSAPFWLDEYLLGEVTYVVIWILAGLGLMILAGDGRRPFRPMPAGRRPATALHLVPVGGEQQRPVVARPAKSDYGTHAA